MKIETFKISVACKDDMKRQDLAESIHGFLNRNLVDTTYAYGAEIEDADLMKTLPKQPGQPRKRRGRRAKAEILAELSGNGELKVERRGHVPAGANAPSNA